MSFLGTLFVDQPNGKERCHIQIRLTKMEVVELAMKEPSSKSNGPSSNGWAPRPSDSIGWNSPSSFTSWLKLWKPRIKPPVLGHVQWKRSVELSTTTTLQLSIQDFLENHRGSHPKHILFKFSQDPYEKTKTVFQGPLINLTISPSHPTAPRLKTWSKSCRSFRSWSICARNLRTQRKFWGQIGTNSVFLGGLALMISCLVRSETFLMLFFVIIEVWQGSSAATFVMSWQVLTSSTLKNPRLWPIIVSIELVETCDGSFQLPHSVHRVLISALLKSLFQYKVSNGKCQVHLQKIDTQLTMPGPSDPKIGEKLVFSQLGRSVDNGATLFLKGLADCKRPFLSKWFP